MKTTAMKIQKLCFVLRELRRELLGARLGLARPGYHLDLNAKLVKQTRAFLEQTSIKCGLLATEIRKYQVQSKSEVFSASLAMLDELEKEPLKLFALPAVELSRRLHGSDELTRVVIAASRAVQKEGVPYE